MGLMDGIKRYSGFKINVQIFVQRKDKGSYTIIQDKAKRIRQSDKKEYGLLKKLNTEFNFNPEDVYIDDKGNRILYLYTRDYIKFVPMEIHDTNKIKPTDIKKLNIYTDNIKRTYEATANRDKFTAMLPMISIMIMIIGFIVLGNFVMEQIATVSGSLGGVAGAMGENTQALEKISDNLIVSCSNIGGGGVTPINVR